MALTQAQLATRASKIVGYTSEAAKQNNISSGYVKAGSAAANAPILANENIAKVNAPVIGTQAMNVPAAPVPTDYMGTIKGASASLASPTTTVDKNGILTTVQPDLAATTATTAPKTTQDILNEKAGLTAPNSEAIYNKTYKESGLQQASKDVQNYTAQINNIMTKAQADTLSLTGQGRGVPEVIIGGQQAQISKEAAIQALPLQALLANAQGNKELAQQHLDTLFKIRMDDATAQFNYKSSVLDAAMQVASRDEQRQYDAIQKADDRKYSEQKSFLETQNDILSKALAYGAPNSVISAISNATDTLSAIKAGGKYMVDPLDRSYKAAQLAKLQIENNANDPAKQAAILNSVVNEKDPTKLISNFFSVNPKIKSNQDINNAAAVVSSINDLSTRLGGGKIKGYGVLGGGFLPEFLKSQEGITNKAQISAVEGKLQQWLSGAALSKAQEKLVNKMIPEKNDTDATVRTKLNNLTNYMLGDIKGRATAQGAQFEYVPVNLFNDKSVVADVKTSTVQAVAAGYKPSEVIDYVSNNYPEKASQIKQARDNGYSDDEIIQYLSL